MSNRRFLQRPIFPLPILGGMLFAKHTYATPRLQPSTGVTFYFSTDLAICVPSL